MMEMKQNRLKICDRPLYILILEGKRIHGEGARRKLKTEKGKRNEEAART